MRNRLSHSFVALAIQTSVLLWACSGSGSDEGESGPGNGTDGGGSFTVTYFGNGNTAGTVPVDATKYSTGQTVTVLHNSGGLAKTGFGFSSWNTKSDGGGSDYPAGGTFSMGTANVELYAKWAASGSLDASFNGGGSGPNTYVYVVTPQGDGKILIGGNFTSYNGTPRNRIARINSNGSLDTSFDPGSGTDDSVRCIIVQGDGKILLGGRFTSFNGTSRKYLARINADGSLDASFDPGSGADSYVNAMALQSDGKIVIGGSFSSYDGTAKKYIARVASNGALDASFNTDSGADSQVTAVALQADGRVVIGGGFTTYDGISRHYIARLDAGGSLDTSFDPGTGAEGYYVLSIALQGDGKICIGGGFTTYDGTARNCIARLNADGSLDTSFDPGSGASSWVDSFVFTGDGKIVIGGHFTAYDGTSRNHLARVVSNGGLDASFDPGTGADDYVYSVVLQSDGKYLIGGWFKNFGGTARNYLARIIP